MTFGLDFSPPTGRWTVAEIEEFPEDNRRRELIEGSLIVRASPAPAHQVVVMQVFKALDDTCPDHRQVTHGMQVRFSDETALVPDGLAYRQGVRPSDTTFFLPGDLVLVAEVIEETSRALDTLVKPALYAASNIPYFWQIELVDGRIVIHTHHSSGAGQPYTPTGTFTGLLTIDEPWPLELPLDQLKPRHL